MDIVNCSEACHIPAIAINTSGTIGKCTRASITAHPADGNDLNGEGVLVVVGGAVLVVGHQLLVAAVLGRHHALYKADELERVRPIVEKEVHALQQSHNAQINEL